MGIPPGCQYPPMGLSGGLLIIINGALAAILIMAAIGKLVSPGELRTATRELSASRFAKFPENPHIRAFALVELSAAVLLLTQTTRVPGAVLTAALGVVFAAFGLLGMLRGASEPCGCLGNPSAAPLGRRNVGIGLAMAVAACAANILMDSGTTAYSAEMLTVSALLTLALCLWVNRKRIVPVLRKAW